MSCKLVDKVRICSLLAAAGPSIFTVIFVSMILSVSAAEQNHLRALQSIGDFGSNPGQLDMYIYNPGGPDRKATMVVALHGCMQEVSDFDDETGLVALAEAHKFLLLLPGQRRANNATRCFNWFREKDNSKGQGESASIRDMVRHALAVYRVDPSKVYVLGLSAGASMAVVLMANYPELFQGGGIVAGTPFGCNSPSLSTWTTWWGLHAWSGDFASASFACGLFFNSPTQRSGEEWGEFVRTSSGVVPSRWPIISIWHGKADATVNPANQQELLKQWANVHGIDLVPDTVHERNHVRHSVYQDADGVPRIETYEVASFGHGIAVDPGLGAENCGRVSPFVEDADICAVLKILQFWGIAPRSNPKNP